VSTLSKKHHPTTGYLIFIIGAIITAMFQIALMLSIKSSRKDVGLFGLVLVGFIVMLIGIYFNRQFYVDNYNAMNPRDIVRNK